MLLRSSEGCKEAAIMALERTNLACLPTLFEILRPQELELLNLKKGRKKNDRYAYQLHLMKMNDGCIYLLFRLRNILGLIRRYIVETMKQGTLVEHEGLRRSYLEYIQV